MNFSYVVKSISCGNLIVLRLKYICIVYNWCLIACERQTFLLAHRHWETFRKLQRTQRAMSEENCVCRSQARCWKVAYPQKSNHFSYITCKTNGKSFRFSKWSEKRAVFTFYFPSHALYFVSKTVPYSYGWNHAKWAMEIRRPRLTLAICRRRWQNDEYKKKVYIYMVVCIKEVLMMKEMIECF